MKLLKLSPDEIRALHAPVKDGLHDLASRIGVQLRAGLPPHPLVEVQAVAVPTQTPDGARLYMHADDDLLAAWVAVRFGAAGIRPPVPVRYGQSLLDKIKAALAGFVLQSESGEPQSFVLEIRLGNQSGWLVMDWAGMGEAELKQWAMLQWAGRKEGSI